MAVARSQVQRRVALDILDVDVSAIGEQHLRARRPTVQRRHVKRRATVHAAAHVHVHAHAGHEQLEAQSAALAAGRVVNGMIAARVRLDLERVRVRQLLDDLIVTVETRQVEYGRVVGGGGRRVGAELDQQADRLLRLAARARHKQRRKELNERFIYSVKRCNFVCILLVQV